MFQIYGDPDAGWKVAAGNIDQPVAHIHKEVDGYFYVTLSAGMYSFESLNELGRILKDINEQYSPTHIIRTTL